MADKSHIEEQIGQILQRAPNGDLAHKSHIEEQIGQIAARQLGNVTRGQLISLGMPTTSIHRWVKRGRLYRVFTGVYSVGRPPAAPIERAAAAVLACGDRAALSHGSAMSLWGFWRQWDLSFELSVVGRRRPSGVKVHRPVGLLQRDVRVEKGIRVTSPARTLLDMAPRIPAKSLRRFINDARRSKILAIGDLADVIRRFPLHPGAALLRPFVKAPKGPTRSEFENLFQDFCVRYGLPTPVFNELVEGREADAYFPDERLIVELDGWEFHHDRWAFEGDRERDAAMLALGIVTVRITWERLRTEPDKEAARLNRILELRRGAGRSTLPA
jgi:hypothetical protein